MVHNYLRVKKGVKTKIRDTIGRMHNMYHNFIDVKMVLGYIISVFAGTDNVNDIIRACNNISSG